MRKKVPFVTPLVFFCLLLSGLTSKAFADVSAQLKQAETYQTNGQYVQAEAIYKQIVTDYSGTDDALQAQEKLACLYVTWGKEPEAQAALEKLKANFSGFPQQEQVAMTVTHVGDTYRDLGKHEKACKVYSYVISTWPQDEHAMWSHMGIVISNACLGNESAAEAAFEQLRAAYSGQQHISRAVCLIADNYRKMERHKKAGELYQYVLTNWPNAPFALWSQMGLAILNIRVTDYDAAGVATDRLLSNFSNDERMPIAVCLIADEYRKSNKYERAVSLYRYVVDNDPNSEHALWSQMGLAISNLYLGDYNAAKDATNRLRADFSKDKRMAVALCLLADDYRRLGKPSDACALYQCAIDNWPDAEQALWSQMGLVISNIYLKDYDAAGVATDKLLSIFSKDSRISAAACLIADEYRKFNKYEEALELYQYVLSNWPQTEHAMWAEVNIGYINVWRGNDSAAQAVTNKLLTSKDLLNSSWAIYQIGEQYYNKAIQLENDGLESQARDRFTKAMTIWERLIVEMPQSDVTPYAYNSAADCYGKLGQHEKAIEYYRKIVDNWPRYQYAWNAQFMIGHTYEELNETGVISKSEVDPKIKAAYEQLLERYPGCIAAEIARYWLSHNK